MDAVTVSGTRITDDGAGTNGIVVVEDTFTLTLTGGATLDGLDVTNHGTIQVSGKATLKIVVLMNFSGVQITVDTGIVLALDGTTIHDGTVTGLGSIEVTGD